MSSAFNPFRKTKNDPTDQPDTTAPTVTNAGNSSPITPSSQPEQKTGTSSGRFSNIVGYLNANKNFNQDAGGLAGKIVGNVDTQKQDFNQNVNTATQTFNQQADQNRKQLDQPFITNTIANAGKPLAATPTPAPVTTPSTASAMPVTKSPGTIGLTVAPASAQTTTAQPTQAPTPTISDSDYNKFADQRDASYKGPTRIENAPKLQVQAQNIQDTTSQLGNENGRFNVLRQMFNKPTYSTGQQKLDNLLIQNNPNQINSLKNAQVLGNGVQNTVNQAQAEADAKAKLYTNEAQATAQSTRDALNNAFTSQDKDLQSKIDVAKAYNDKIAQEVKNKQFTTADAAKLGLTAGDTYGVNDLTNYLRNLDPTKQNVANTDDYSRYQALAKLANIDPTLLVNNTQAGAFDKFDHFDTNKFNADVAQAKGAYDKAASPYKGELARGGNIRDYNILDKILNPAPKVDPNDPFGQAMVKTPGLDLRGATAAQLQAAGININTPIRFNNTDQFNGVMASYGIDGLRNSLSPALRKQFDAYIAANPDSVNNWNGFMGANQDYLAKVNALYNIGNGIKVSDDRDALNRQVIKDPENPSDPGVTPYEPAPQKPASKFKNVR